MKSLNSNLPTSILVTFGFLVLLLLPFEPLLSLLGFGRFVSEHLGDTLKNLFIVIFGVVMIRRFGYRRMSGLTKFRPENLYLIIIPFYFILAGPAEYWLLNYQFHQIDPMHILVLLVSTLSVGFSEEIIFRGFVLTNLIEGKSSGQSIAVPILISSALFGILHFLNLFQADAHIITVLAQVVYATMFGIGFGVILLRSGSIYPIGFVHGLINFFSSWDQLPGAVEPTNVNDFKTWEAFISVVIVLPFFLYMVSQIKSISLNGKHQIGQATEEE